MSINDSQARLKCAAKDLDRQWNLIIQTWRDENRRQFEDKYIAPMRLELRKCELAMERIDAVVHRMRADCE